MKDLKGSLSRREFMAAGAATLAGTSLLSLAGCDTAIIGPNVDAYELNVGYAEYFIDGLRLRTRTFGRLPGPTLETAPGRILRVRINNNLPPNPPPGDGGGGGGGGGHEMIPGRVATGHNINDPHKFNTTNLHIHGPQVRPHLFAPFGTSNPSAPMLAIEPGKSYTYDFEIPQDQPSGLYWYHPHHHGSTAVQVYSGMAGLVVIRGPIDEVTEIKAAREELICVQMLRLNPSREDPSLWVQDPIANTSEFEGGFSGAGDRNYFLVNGKEVGWITRNQSAPTTQLAVDSIQMRPGEVVRFRVLNAQDELLMRPSVDGHSLHLIAYDGVNFLEPQNMEDFQLAPGNRGEFMLKAGAPGTYALRALPVTGQQFNDTNGFVMANIVVSGAPMDMALPTSLPMAVREYPFIEASDVVAHKTLAFTFFAPYPELITGLAFMINGKLYETERIDQTVRLNTCEEWLLTADDTEGHPFHVHVNSFWVIEENGVPLDPPVVKDVVFIPRNGSVKIRMRFRQWVGKAVYHCHILFHEDTGMMQNFLIQP